MNSLNNIKKGIVFKKLVKYGLFPESLSQIFTSEKFGNWIIIHGLTKYKKADFSSIKYHLTRNNNAPRIIDIPHPIAYFKICDQIRINWDKITSKLGEVESYEKKSMIIPKPNNINKRLISLMSYNLRKDDKFLTLDKSIGSKYYVHADISNCYPSIYTHAITWALVGQKVSKNNIGDRRKWYNKFDQTVRSAQRNESIGIAIGPDTSHLICEVILSRVDVKLNQYRYKRFIDDYKCFCNSKEQADSFVRDLSVELEKYRLRLNVKKTKIEPLPIELEDSWVRELKSFSRNFLKRNSNELSFSDINHIGDFLDLSINLSKKYPDQSPIKYSVRILSKKIFKDDDAYIFTIMYLSRICFIYPYFIDVFQEILKKNPPSSTVKKVLAAEINTIAKEHIKYARSDVALWCIYIALKYKFNLTSFESYSNKLLSKRDCLPSLMCYYYSIKKNKSTSKYFEIINKIIQEKLEDEWWLYIYELFKESPKKAVFRSIQYKDFYIEMKNKNISFTDL